MPRLLAFEPGIRKDQLPILINQSQQDSRLTQYRVMRCWRVVVPIATEMQISSMQCWHSLYSCQTCLTASVGIYPISPLGFYKTNGKIISTKIFPKSIICKNYHNTTFLKQIDPLSIHQMDQNIKETRKRVLFLLQIIVSIILFYTIFKHINLNQIRNVAENMQIGYFLIALLVKLSSILLSTAMLGVVIEILHLFVPYKELLKIYFSSFFYNSLGIGTIGGDLYRWYKLQKINGSNEASSLIIMTEKIIIFSVLLSFAFVGLLIAALNGSYIMLFLLIPLPFVFVWGLSQVFRNLFHILGQIQAIKKWYPFETFSLHLGKIPQTPPAQIARAILFSSLFYIVNIIAFAFIVYSVDQTIPLSLSIIIVPVVILFTSLPITFQGFGLREITVAYLFPALGYSSVTGAIVAILYLFANLAVAGISGLYTISHKIKIKPDVAITDQKWDPKHADSIHIKRPPKKNKK